MAPEIGWVAGWLAASFLVTFVALAIAVRWTLRPLTRSGEILWYERARLAQPARLTVGLSTFTTMPLSAMFGLLPGRAVAEGSEMWFGFAGMAGAILAEFCTSYRLSRRLLGPRIRAGYWLGGLIVYCAMFFGGVVAFGIVLLSTPTEFNARTVIVLAGCVIGLLLWLRGGHLRFLSLLGLATPASSRLQGIVSEAATRAGMSPPRAYELRWPMVNAIAFPQCGAVAVTDSAMEFLDDAQLTAVCVHELAHLKEPRRITVLRTLAAMMLMPVAAAMILAQTYGAWVIVVTIGLFLLASRMVGRMSRRLEQDADLQAKGEQPANLDYARALESLYRANLLPLVGHLRGGTHPHGYDRLIAAGMQPEFPRPASPPWLRGVAGALIVTALVLIAYLAGIIALDVAGIIDLGHNTES